MRIRLKFTKCGNTKFVGHLDTIRFFQRTIRAAGIPIAYSEGFNPHAKVYFAMPLSVGMSSKGEYMELITKEDVDVTEVKELLNKELPEGIKILEAFVIEGKKDSLMSLVKRASYKIEIRKETLSTPIIPLIEQKMLDSELLVEKKTKKGMKQVDIKPLLMNVELNEENEKVEMVVEVAAGSSQNLSPELFLKAVLGEESLQSAEYAIERLELYAVQGNEKIAIDELSKK